MRSGTGSAGAAQTRITYFRLEHAAISPVGIRQRATEHPTLRPLNGPSEQQSMARHRALPLIARGQAALLLFTATLLLVPGDASAQIGINSTATAPNNRSILDLSDASRGLLLPRMTRAERVAIAAPAPANSLLVYQTDDFVPAPPALPEPKGLWYRDGANWVRVGSGGPAWQLGGNAGTNPTTNFVGTTDAQDLSIRTNGQDRIRIVGAGSNVGFVGVNQPTPQERLEVNGALRQNGTTATAKRRHRCARRLHRQRPGLPRHRLVPAGERLRQQAQGAVVAAVDQLLPVPHQHHQRAGHAAALAHHR